VGQRGLHLLDRVHAREHHAGGPGVECPPGADPLVRLDSHQRRHAVSGGGQQLADERVLAGAVLEIDQQPVEAGERAGFGRERRAEVEERPERRFAGPESVAQGHPCHRWVARPS
jgi:hypothetical protein